jgi:uncharacterized membrane protein
VLAYCIPSGKVVPAVLVELTALAAAADRGQIQVSIAEVFSRMAVKVEITKAPRDTVMAEDNGQATGQASILSISMVGMVVGVVSLAVPVVVAVALLHRESVRQALRQAPARARRAVLREAAQAEPLG